jgi:hypothetical protein
MKRLVLLLAFFSIPVGADDRAHPYSDRPLDFALTLSTRSYDLDYGGSNVDTSVDRVTASWRERYGPYLQLGFLGGPAYLTQTNNAATSGRELNGYHVGLSLDIDLLRRERVDVFFSAAWLYQKLDHADGSQRVVITTHEPSARLGAGLLLAKPVRAYGGARYGSIRGEQRQSGTINETRTVRESQQAGGFAGLELLLDRDGYVGLYAESGIDRSVGIYFGRHF